MKALLQILQSPLLLLLDLIAPRLCAACHEEALPVPCAFCQTCLEKSRFLQKEVEGAWALFSFEGPVQDAVHRVKYESNDQAASSLGLMLGSNIPKSFSLFDLVVPAPVGKKRLRERGFDQAAILAKEVSRALGLRFAPAALQRQKETKALAKLDKETRREAISGAFIASSVAKNKKIILVDDVVTTGATTDAAKEALLAAGAQSIAVVCVAKTLKYLA